MYAYVGQDDCCAFEHWSSTSADDADAVVAACVYCPLPVRELHSSTTGVVLGRPDRLVQASAQVGPRGDAVVRVPGLQNFRPTRHPEYDRPLHELHLLHHARYAPRGVALGAAGRRHAHIIG